MRITGAQGRDGLRFALKPCWNRWACRLQEHIPFDQLPFTAHDATAGSEDELQAVVVGSSEHCDLAAQHSRIALLSEHRPPQRQRRSAPPHPAGAGSLPQRHARRLGEQLDSLSRIAAQPARAARFRCRPAGRARWLHRRALRRRAFSLHAERRALAAHSHQLCAEAVAGRPDRHAAAPARTDAPGSLAPDASFPERQHLARDHVVPHRRRRSRSVRWASRWRARQRGVFSSPRC